MNSHRNLLKWNIADLAKAMKISEEDVKLYFKDGRRASFIIERLLNHEVFHGRLPPNEGTDYDIIDNEGNKWEVKSLTKDGIYFCPSYMVGSGRSFDEKGFLRKLNDIKGYVVADITKFPNIPFWIVPKNKVLSWWKKKLLGYNTKISRQKALKLLNKI